jgi:hypothetical protein
MKVLHNKFPESEIGYCLPLAQSIEAAGALASGRMILAAFVKARHPAQGGASGNGIPGIMQLFRGIALSCETSVS